jgi:hypothetical protein
MNILTVLAVMAVVNLMVMRVGMSRPTLILEAIRLKIDR